MKFYPEEYIPAHAGCEQRDEFFVLKSNYTVVGCHGGHRDPKNWEMVLVQAL